MSTSSDTWRPPAAHEANRVVLQHVGAVEVARLVRLRREAGATLLRPAEHAKVDRLPRTQRSTCDSIACCVPCGMRAMLLFWEIRSPRSTARSGASSSGHPALPATAGRSPVGSRTGHSAAEASIVWSCVGTATHRAGDVVEVAVAHDASLRA